MVIVREAIENDILQILEIEREAISPPWTHGALLCEIYKDDSFFAVAVDEARGRSSQVRGRSPCLVGFAVLRRVGDDGEVLQIAVDKVRRRGGVGSLLMVSALDYARDNKLVSVFLEVRRSNTSALALYKKHGFKSVRVRKGYYDDPVEDAVVMVKTWV